MQTTSRIVPRKSNVAFLKTKVIETDKVTVPTVKLIIFSKMQYFNEHVMETALDVTNNRRKTPSRNTVTLLSLDVTHYINELRFDLRY